MSEVLKNAGEVRIFEVRGCKAPTKVQLGFEELIPGVQNPLSRLNRSDSRFNQPKPVKAWLTVEVEDAKEAFPKLAEAIDEAQKANEVVEVSLMNPTLDGEPLHIQIIESTGEELVDELALTPYKSRKESLEYMLTNYSTRAKRAGKDGDYLMSHGSPIFRETNVVNGLPEHRYIAHNGRADSIGVPALGVDLVFDEEEVETPKKTKSKVTA